MAVLMYLQSRQDGVASLKEIEKMSKVSQPANLGVVNRLEQKGYVESYGSSNDRRVKMIRLSKTGKDICTHAFIEIDKTEDQLTRTLSEDEKAEFEVLLKKISDHLE